MGKILESYCRNDRDKFEHDVNIFRSCDCVSLISTDGGLHQETNDAAKRTEQYFITMNRCDRENRENYSEHNSKSVITTVFPGEYYIAHPYFEYLANAAGQYCDDFCLAMYHSTLHFCLQYVFDKKYADEIGRPFLVMARRAVSAFKSVDMGIAYAVASVCLMAGLPELEVVVLIPVEYDFDIPDLAKRISNRLLEA